MSPLKKKVLEQLVEKDVIDERSAWKSHVAGMRKRLGGVNPVSWVKASAAKSAKAAQTGAPLGIHKAMKGFLARKKMQQRLG